MHTIDERLVDLEDVDGETAQIAERRVSGAKVVDGQTHAQGPQFGQTVDHRFTVAYQDALGDLQDKRVRRQSCFSEGAGEDGGQAGLMYLASGNIHGHRQGRLLRVLQVPLSGLPASLSQHPRPDRQDKPRLLRHMDEVVGLDQPAGGVTPADERLDARDPAIRQGDAGLIVQFKLAPIDGALEVTRQFEPLDQRCLHRRIVQREAILAAALCRVHRDIGASEEFFRGGRRGAYSATDTHPDKHLPIAEDDRRAQSIEKPLGHSARIAISHQILDQDGKLISTKSSRRIANAQAGLDAPGDLLEHRIARRMSEAVVHRLEVVEIHKEHRQRLTATSRPRKAVIQTVREASAVRESGERIVKGLKPQLILELAAAFKRLLERVLRAPSFFDFKLEGIVGRLKLGGTRLQILREIGGELFRAMDQRIGHQVHIGAQGGEFGGPALRDARRQITSGDRAGGGARSLQGAADAVVSPRAKEHESHHASGADAERP